jgi:hypothetical protein
MSVAIALPKSEIKRGERILVANRHVSDSRQAYRPRIRRNDCNSHARIDQTDDGCEFLDLPDDLRPKAGRRAQSNHLPVEPDT